MDDAVAGAGNSTEGAIKLRLPWVRTESGSLIADLGAGLSWMYAGTTLSLDMQGHGSTFIKAIKEEETAVRTAEAISAVFGMVFARYSPRLHTTTPEELKKSMEGVQELLAKFGELAEQWKSGVSNSLQNETTADNINQDKGK